MQTPEYRDFPVTVELVVTATTLGEAREALRRSGVRDGVLIGEALVMDVTVFDPTEGE